MSARLGTKQIEGLHRFCFDVTGGPESVTPEGVRVCANCGVLVFERLAERHRRICEPRSYDLEPLSPTEIGP